MNVGRIKRKMEPGSLAHHIERYHLNPHITLLHEQEINFYSIMILKFGNLFITIASIILTNRGIITGLKLT